MQRGHHGAALRQPRPRVGRVLADATRSWSRAGNLAIWCCWRPPRLRPIGRAHPRRLPRRSRPMCPRPSTRVLVLYRVENGFARREAVPTQRPASTARFDVQVRQSLPFLDFSSAKWEMLVAVRNFFRDATSRPVGLRRTARRPAAEAGRRRPDAALLSSPCRLRSLAAIHQYWNQLAVSAVK